MVRSVANSTETFSRVGDWRFIDIFGDDEPGPDVGDNPEHFRPQIDRNAPASRRSAEGLAWKPAADSVNGNSICTQAGAGKLADVGIAGHVRPVLGEHAPAEVIDLAERGRSHSGPLEAEAKAADLMPENKSSTFNCSGMGHLAFRPWQIFRSSPASEGACR